VYDQALLLSGGVFYIVLAVVTSTIGIFALSCGVCGWLFTHIEWIGRMLLFAGGLCLVTPGWVTDMVGICLIVPVVRINYQKASIKSRIQVVSRS
jgi:TRAP-type uncharacterized transport system fused permease subunit